MIICTIPTSDCTPQTIVIGRRTTYDTLQVVFDLSYLAETYGSGAAVLVVKRSQDETAYPATITQDGNTLTWTITEVDTYYVGAGECELMWYVNNGLAKTIIYPVVVMRDILQTAEEPPDGYENWVEHLTALGAKTQQHALDAAQSATEAETAQGKAEDAQSAAETAQGAAEEAAERAETAIVHAPIIQGGYWYIWDNGQYVNTNVRAEGEKGDKGDTGEKGDTGNGIASITKTGTAGLVDTYTVTYTDGTTTTFTVTNGAKGDKGDTGATGNGIASIAKTGTSGNVDTYTITYTNGQTTTFTVTNGAVSSVAGKTGAVTLDANDVAFSESGTYDDGTVGKELSDQKNAIDQLETDISTLIEDVNSQSIWSQGRLSVGSSGGSIVEDTKAITTTNMITDNVSVALVDNTCKFSIAVYSSADAWMGFLRYENDTYSLNYYNGTNFTAISYSEIASAYPSCKIRIMVQKVSISVTISPSEYAAVSITKTDIPSPYTSNPAMDGTASPGVSGNFARGDHVHPSDTSKADKTSYVTLSGTQVTQTGADNTMYLCGELTELTFNTPAQGQTAIRFRSGTTPTVASFPNVTEWMGGFDPDNLEASVLYEINVLYGVGVAQWT